MATISFTIPDDQVQRAINAMCATHGYQDKLDDGSANPESKAQFCRRKIREYVRDITLNYEANVAAETARLSVLATGLTVTGS